jgi:hypothetical protein
VTTGHISVESEACGWPMIRETSLDQEIKRVCMITVVWYPVRSPDILLTALAVRYCSSLSSCLSFLLSSPLPGCAVNLFGVFPRPSRWPSTLLLSRPLNVLLVPNLMASLAGMASVSRMLRKRELRNENRSTCRRLG